MKTITTWVETTSRESLLQRLAAKQWFWLALFGLSLFSILSFIGGRLLVDADTFWHIAAGKWILANHAVPATDPFSFSFHGAKWVPHEWLAEVILGASHAWLGWTGPVLVTALATAVALTMLLRFLLRYIEPLHAFAGTALAFLTLAQHLLARPHALAWPLMVIWAAQLVLAREQGKRPSLWLPVVMLAWANLHGSFLLGIGLAGALAVEAILAEGHPRRSAQAWAPFLALTVLAGLLTPNGVDGLLFPFHVSGMGFSLSIISEWKAPDFRLIQPIELWLGFVLFGALYFGFRLPATRILMCFGLVHLALAFARYAELPGLLAPLLLMPSVGPQLRAAIRPEIKPRLSSRSIRIITALCMALFMASIAFLAKGIQHDQGRIQPREAVDAAMAAGAAGPVFNSYNFGGYLIFSGIAPLIDGRADLYGDDFVRRYMAAYSGDAKILQALMQEYKVRWAVLEPTSPASKLINGLPSWRKVHEDANAVAYVREQ
ncbi:hypothetical membrane protein [Cupriavidus necator N-1]|uniref:Hypothetical membrane protein n=1 Tax=Cupriavidus necator (strain ATCC 43291 / DSM 13513 / CCUG 52238 / LMG 8453 / N-1) TaxID=1042878 RepID=G0EXI4_CUPNN|nr:hypothetical protein [Cupriavidus necator]AEI76089.1 hypothetical membrane protein [Cupriavidus necator N-1]MDX6011780.1 hypothetical protein [Cupriavidus necator]